MDPNPNRCTIRLIHASLPKGWLRLSGNDPSEIKPAIEKALKHETEKKLTVIDVVLSDFNPR